MATSTSGLKGLLPALLLGMIASPAFGAGKEVTLGGILAQSLTLSGYATVTEDLLIPEGVTLTLLPGAVLGVVPSEGTLTNPPFLLTSTEIVVHGSLLAPGGKVDIRPAGTVPIRRGSWGGIILPQGSGKVVLKGTSLAGAEFGLLALAGRAELTDCLFLRNDTGVGAAAGTAEVAESRNTFIGNGTGVAWWGDRERRPGPGDTFSGNDDDARSSEAAPPALAARELVPRFPEKKPRRTREYLGDSSLEEDTVWQGEVLVEGQVTVPDGVTLTIRPGARVLFRWRDTDGDRLGESWITVQGRLRVEGSEEAWVLFDAEKPERGPGAWDSLSLIASDAPDNLVRYAVFRRGVKAFHDHFSRATLEKVVFEDNLRGVQFQESEGMTVTEGLFRRNRSAMRFRDSSALLAGLTVSDNQSGLNFLRSTVLLTDSLFTGNRVESLQSRESGVKVSRAAFTGNRQGPRFKGQGAKDPGDEEEARLTAVLSLGNLEDGASFQKVKARLDSCELSGNGLDGAGVTDAALTVRDSRIAGNGRYAVDNAGGSDVDASGNDWGRPGGPLPEEVLDGTDEPVRGKVRADRPLPQPRLLLFPGMGALSASMAFSGTLVVAGDVTAGGLNLGPGAKVLFAPAPEGSLFDLCSDHPSFPGGELVVRGEAKALGEPGKLVTFAPLGASRAGTALRVTWGGVNLSGARGGEFRSCLFTGAETGLHLAESGPVSVEGCRFEGNANGVRFSFTPVTLIRNTFRGNGNGLRFHQGTGTISGNEFYGNRTALFITGPYSDVTLAGDTFGGSGEYHVQLGELVTQEVDLKAERFLPDAGGRPLAELVFDRLRDPELGRVLLP